MLVGALLETNLVKAVEMALTQRKVAEDFTATFPNETVQRWKCMVKEWQANSLLPNPYGQTSEVRFFVVIYPQHLIVVFPASKVSEVRLRLTQEEVTEAERGQHTPHKISASVFVRMGLDLEDQQ